MWDGTDRRGVTIPGSIGKYVLFNLFVNEITGLPYDDVDDDNNAIDFVNIDLYRHSINFFKLFLFILLMVTMFYV